MFGWCRRYTTRGTEWVSRSSLPKALVAKNRFFDWFSAALLRCAATPGPAAAPARASRSDALWCPHASQSHPSSPIVLAGPSQLSTAPRWLSTAKYMRPGAEAWAAGPPPPIPCPHAPPTRPPLPWQAFRTRSPHDPSSNDARCLHAHALARCNGFGPGSTLFVRWVHLQRPQHVPYGSGGIEQQTGMLGRLRWVCLEL